MIPQYKRQCIVLKRQQTKENKEEAVEYAKLSAKSVKEAKEKHQEYQEHQERTAKRHRLPSPRASTSKTESSQT